jgi:WD40 repeat protein
MKIIFRLLGLVAIFVVLTTCGGGDSTPPPTVVISVTPTAQSLMPGEQQQFSSAVTGTANTGVTWTVQEGATGGSIDVNGVYTADIVNGTFHVIATSQADTSKSATAMVTVTGPFVVTPSSDVLGPLGVRAFSANGKVTWSVQEGAAGGAITADGQYTAPSAPGLFHVVATSELDATKTVVVNVTVTPSGFRPTGDMTIGRTGHTATLLPNGKVLVAGGDSCYYSFYYYADECAMDSAEIYDPVAGTFIATGKMAVKRLFHTATLLSNGKVLVTGGGDASAELYDPATGKFTATGSMSVGRGSHTATLLASGQVLIVGGTSVSGQLSTAELYDPTSGHFTPTGSMIAPRASPTATRLADGRVLVVGGSNANTNEKTAELYDPATGIFSLVGSMTDARSGHTATRLQNSSVLVTGGADGTSVLSSAELFDSTTHVFTLTGHMMTARVAHFAVLLADGSVLVAGGEDATAEVYDATSGSFSQTGYLKLARTYAAAVLLPDGRVLVTGGSDSNSAEIYK